MAADIPYYDPINLVHSVGYGTYVRAYIYKSRQSRRILPYYALYVKSYVIGVVKKGSIIMKSEEKERYICRGERRGDGEKVLAVYR